MISFPISANLDYCLIFLKEGILIRFTKRFWANGDFELVFLKFRFLLLTTITDKTTWQTAGKQDMLTMILTDDEAATSQSNSNGKVFTNVKFQACIFTIQEWKCIIQWNLNIKCSKMHPVNCYDDWFCNSFLLRSV